MDPGRALLTRNLRSPWVRDLANTLADALPRKLSGVGRDHVSGRREEVPLNTSPLHYTCLAPPYE